MVDVGEWTKDGANHILRVNGILRPFKIVEKRYFL